MGLFDALTGNAAKQGVKNGQQALLAGQTLGMGQITDRLGDASRLMLGEGGSGANALRSGYDIGRQALTDKYGSTQGYLGGIQTLYQPMASGGQSAFNALLDATGANGADGNARATSAFQAGPGYEFTKSQGLDALTSLASARGMLGSRNLDADTMKYATGLADQTFGNYVSRLQGVMPTYQAGVAGQAQGLTGQAQASQTYGQNVGTMDQGFGQNLGGLYGQLAGFNVNAGNSAAGLINQTSQGIADLGMKGAQAQGQASANLLGAIGGAINLGLSPLPTGGIGNTLIGSLFK